MGTIHYTHPSICTIGKLEGSSKKCPVTAQSKIALEEYASTTSLQAYSVLPDVQLSSRMTSLSWNKLEELSTFIDIVPSYLHMQPWIMV